jgi:hypothetical protein
LAIFDQILSLQISLVFNPSDFCELNDTEGRKGNQQRIKTFIVMIIINIKHERGCLLSVSLFSEVAHGALCVEFQGAKTKKAEPLQALPLSIGIRF